MSAAITPGEAWSALIGARARRSSDGGPPPIVGLGLGPAGWHADRPVEPAAAALLDLYLAPALAGPGRPLVIGHLGQSIDGRIATAEGHSQHVTGPENIRHLHRMRALADAVVVGVETAERDDPALTTREVEGPSPVRVVLDPRNRLRADRRLLHDDAAPVLRVVQADRAPAGVPGIVPVPGRGLALDLAAVLAALRERGLACLFVEGGGVTVSRFLQAGLLDRLQITVAPVILGSGRQGLTLPAVSTMAEALRPPCRTVPMGGDILFEFALR